MAEAPVERPPQSLTRWRPGALMPAAFGALYNLLWYPVLPFALRFSAPDPAGRRERRGAAPMAAADGDGPRVWIHAASVGEIEAVQPVASGLLCEFPRLRLVVTTMTQTGRAAAERRLPAASCRLAPLDFRRATRTFLAHLRPQLVLVAETELWPNFFIEAARAGARVAIINGRISERSMRRYRWIRPLLAPALAQATLILAQTAQDADRYRKLGAAPDRVIVTGNTKFENGAAPSPLRPALTNFAVGQPLLIAGSTAPGEEPMVLAAYAKLRQRFPTLALVIAPRHLARVPEVSGLIQAATLPFAMASTLTDPIAEHQPHHESAHELADVLLLDTMGELRALYRRATLAFVGGSLAPPRGGQNLAEPAACAMPVMFGPHYENQQYVGDALRAAGGGRVVRDADDLARFATTWLSDDHARHAAGARAAAVIEHLSGGAARTVAHLAALLRTGG